MNIEPETEKKIQELQILEQGLQNFLMQKQAIDAEANEISNALEELKKSGDEVYRIIGNVMVKSEKKTLTEELSEKKKLFELRISSIEKQEKLVGEKTEKLRKEVSEAISKKK
jgi:prefoldin beta subunit